MQIESPPTLLSLSFLSRLSLFTPFQRLCGNEGVWLVQRDLPNPAFFCSHICFLLLLLLLCCHSRAVPSLFLPLVTLIRSVCGPEMACVLMWTQGSWDWWLLWLVKCLCKPLCTFTWLAVQRTYSENTSTDRYNWQLMLAATEKASLYWMDRQTESRINKVGKKLIQL